jgi:hypothetical protein
VDESGEISDSENRVANYENIQVRRSNGLGKESLKEKIEKLCKESRAIEFL